MDERHVADFSRGVEPNYQIRLENNRTIIEFENANGEPFVLLWDDILMFLSRWLDKVAEIENFMRQHENARGNPWTYNQNPYRAAIEQFFPDSRFRRIRALARSQTKPFLVGLSKVIGYKTDNRNCTSDHDLLLDPQSLNAFFAAF